MRTKGDRVAVCASALPDMNVSSMGSPSMKPPVPLSIKRRLTMNGFDVSFFMSLIRSRKAIEERLAGHDGQREITEVEHAGTGQAAVVVDDPRDLCRGQITPVHVAHH